MKHEKISTQFQPRKSFFLTAIIFLLSVSFFSVQAQNCSAPPAPSVNWSGCDKSGAFLQYADLSDANLSGANLSGANLIGANLIGANLIGANLSGANLSGANLSYSFLDQSNMGSADLSSAYLNSAYLLFTNLTNANLTGANLSGVNLLGANLTGATLTGVASGGIEETPNALPSGWALVDGYLVHTFTVTFDANGGTTPSPATVSVTYNAPYGALATASRPCYAFNGWFTERIGGTQITSASTVGITSNQTLYAQWTAINYNYTETIVACSSYEWHGNTYTSSNNTATWTGTNAAGCDSIVTLNLTIVALPTITCTDNIIVNNDHGLCGALVTFADAMASGSSTPAVTYTHASGSLFPVGTTTVIATTSNSCGVDSCSFTVTVNDVQSPSFVGPEQWASSVLEFSSEYSINYWGANQALGYPNVYPYHGDIALTWASAYSDNAREFISLGYNTPMYVSAIDIYETYNPGAIDSISLRNASTGVWYQVWTGTAEPYSPINTSRIFTVTIPSTSYLVDAVRIAINSLAVPGWNEIDAVALKGSLIENITAVATQSCTAAISITEPTATDNCSINLVSGVRSDGLALNALYPSGVTTISWTASDIHGNVNNPLVQTITVTGGVASTATEPIVACGSYEWHGNTYTSSNNTATWTGTNAAGCDSIVTLNLTINQPSYTTETIVACDSYDWKGTTYTSSNNTATWTGTNAAGCDSIVTLNLTINSAPTATITGNTTFCAGGNTILTTNATSGGGGSVMATAAGAGHSLFLKNDGTVWATGNNNYGQLGDGTNVDKNTPVQLSGLNGITAMAGGALHSLFLQNDGTVWATGNNNYGQLGDGTYELKNTPVQVSGLSGISAIIAGDFHSLFLKNDGSVWAVGANQIGQFGDGTYVSTNIPVQVSGLSGITAMAGGSVHSLFLKNDGTVWATGYNGEGQLGDGTYVYKNTPVQVSGLSGITAITVRASHSLFLKNDGTVWATGNNNYGQLGDGTYENKNTPVQVSGLSDFTSIAAGAYHSLFLMNDGTLWATGFNNFGQLGDGTYELKNTPVQVSGLSGTTAIAAGYNHSLFLKNDGTVRATGRNNVGQLGDGTYESKNTPVPVSGFDVTITSYQWKLNGSDIAGATNATYTATTEGNYTVVVTNSNGCSVTSESVNVTVNQPSTAPSSINSSVAFATAGVNFTLSVNGGSLGTGAAWKWYTGSCGGTLIGTGASISVSQSANTTYFVRAEGTCNTTACATITVDSFCGATGVTSSAGATAICAGSPVTLTVIGSLSPGASWRWDDECDDADANHTCTNSSSSTFTVSPTSTKTYYVRSVGGTCGLTACVPVTINVIAKPATPGTISGSASVCPSSSVTYTIAAVAGATSYTWTAPTNGTLVSAQGATSMTVSYASAFNSGTLKVKANNCSGSSSDKSLSVSKQAAPATPGTISGAAAPCKNSTQTYSIAAVTGANSYTWALPTGVTFVTGSSQTGTSIQVVVASTFTSGTLSVKANNCGGSSSLRTQALTAGTAPTAPGTITGPSSVTQNTANNTFSVSNVAGITYNWAVPAGCTITLGQGTSTIKVTWGTVAGNVSVTCTNACGNSATRTKAVKVTRSAESDTNAGAENAFTEETMETVLTAAEELSTFALYPNPTTGEARIAFSATAVGQYTISIVDLQGRVINSTSGAAFEGNNIIEINLSNCSNGMYMIHLMHNDTLQTLRVMKM